MNFVFISPTFRPFFHFVTPCASGASTRWPSADTAYETLRHELRESVCE